MDKIRKEESNMQTQFLKLFAAWTVAIVGILELIEVIEIENR
jgi:hypothetical protein